jgi:hypothetical protein
VSSFATTPRKARAGGRAGDAGQAFQIPPETPHAGGKPPTENVHLMINYIVEKGKPLIKFV